MNQNPYAQYQQTATQTASPERLLIMLYEGAIRFGNLALVGLEEKNFEKANNNIVRVYDIVNELAATLDVEKGQEVARSLFSLYDYFKRRLIEANVKKDPEILKEVLMFITELKEAFQEAAVSFRKAGGAFE